ncbi:MAG: hypothetical protein GY822_24375 [Deltaproteobacteria bacterium]|nr:hypothetical protein [Deltaproteobacteria bacterium]
MEHGALEKPKKRLYGRGMQPRLGPFLGFYARRFLDAIVYSEDTAKELKELSKKGLVVYVHRARDPAEHLALSRMVKRLGLPVPRFVGGLNVFPFQTVLGALRRRRGLKGAPKDPNRREEWLLQRCLRTGDAAELFLRRPLTLVTSSKTHPAAYMEALINLQRNLDTPIFLVPHFLALRQKPSRLEPGITDAIFGTHEEPGVIRAYARLLWGGRGAHFEVSKPINLKQFVDERPTQDDVVLAKKIRWVLLHHLHRLELMTHGPPMKTPQRMREDVLKDPTLRQTLHDEAAQQKVEESTLKIQAAKIYDEIAARFDIDVVRVGDAILKRIWRIIYDGLETDDDDIDRLKEAGQKGPLVLVPSHRSHIDYLVMTQVMMWNGMLPPLVAAGINLSFFPAGPFLRRGGAFFIRRSFKGDPLYARVFKAYVKRLFKEGFTIEFFIEGGRSRSGKSLHPKLGVLTALIEAFLDGRQDDALFVPANISYEKIVEMGSYTKELRGGEKTPETATALVQSASVLRSRYGRVFVRFDDAISLKDFIAARGETRESLLEDEKSKRELVRSLGYLLVYGINRAQVVTANALTITVLLSYRKRGLDVELLHQTVSELLAHIRGVSEGRPRFSEGLEEDPVGQTERALRRLVKDKLVHEDQAAGKRFLRIDENAFLNLDYYRNNIIHHLVPEALLASAVRSLGGLDGKKLEFDEVKHRAFLLSRLFKFEFIYQANLPFEQLFARTVSRTSAYNLIESNGEAITVRDNGRAKGLVEFAANTIAHLVDAYRLVLQALPDEASNAESRKALVLAVLERARAGTLSGELVCAEAASKINIENAISLVVELGGLQFDEKGKPEANVAWFTGDGAALREVLEDARLRN